MHVAETLTTDPAAFLATSPRPPRSFHAFLDRLTFMLCGGFYLDPRHIPAAIAWLPNVGFTTFTFPSLMMIVHAPAYGALGLQCDAGDDAAAQYGGACPVSGQAVLDTRGVDGTVGAHVAILIGMLLLYRVVAYCCLRFLHKPKYK